MGWHQRARKVAPVERGKLIHIKRFVAQSICPVISYEFFNSNAIASFLEATFYFFICFLRDFPGRTFFLFLPWKRIRSENIKMQWMQRSSVIQRKFSRPPWPTKIWFSNRAGTSIDDCAHKSNNWLDAWPMWATEVVFSPFCALSRRQLTFPSYC